MIQSLDRAMTILEILENRGMATVTEIAAELDVNKSTASRLLETLKAHDMVRLNPASKKYMLGFRILYLSEGVKRNLNIIAIGRPYLLKLYNDLGDSVHLCTFTNDSVYVVDQIQSNKTYSLSANIGMEEPLHCSSVGKCILANSNPNKVDRILKDYDFEVHTANTITNADDLKASFVKIREQGYAMDDEEVALGVRCIAAPIYDYRGNIKYSLGISGTTGSINEQTQTRYVSALTNTCAQISKALGYKRGYRP